MRSAGPERVANLCRRSVARRCRRRSALVTGSALRRRTGVAMEHVGVQVGPVWPHDRPELLVHAHLPKELRIVAERLEDGSPQLGFEVDLAHRAVIEAEPKHEALKWLDRADTRCACADAHGSGSIVSKGKCASARSQFASSSARCMLPHSCTSLSAR